MKRIFATAVLLSWGLSAALHAAETVAQKDKEAAAPEAPTRAAHLTALQDRGAVLAGREEIIWLEQERFWMVVQPARTSVRGAVLLLADADTSANGNSHLAALRRHLPSFGWHTYFLNLPEEAGVAGLVEAARARMQSAPNQLLACEGQACLRLVEGGIVHAAGSVYINVPLLAGEHVAPALVSAWSQAAAPALLLQEHPNVWPEVLTLSEDFELHLLPVSRAANGSLLERKLRGWLKRRLQAG